jgi:hypothetical protein
MFPEDWRNRISPRLCSSCFSSSISAADGLRPSNASRNCVSWCTLREWAGSEDTAPWIAATDLAAKCVESLRV